jgi:diguanylate cyclase (GGDEF)-like protein/PAS domain S-box-containing protein
MIQGVNGIKGENKAPFWEQFSRKLLHIGKEFNPIKAALRIAGIYTLLGALWILLSDKVLERIVQDKKMLTLMSMVKGWAFVLVSGGMIFGLVYTALRRIHGDKLKIVRGYEEITATYEELEAAHEELTASEEELRQQFDSLLESQKQLSESEERYRLISEATNDGIWDEQEDKRYFSDRWFEITGYTREDLDVIEDWKSLIHPDDYEAANAIMVEHQQRKTPFYRCDYRLKGKNGKYIWIQARGKALFDEVDNVYRMAGSHTDITELKEYQETLHHMAYHDILTGLPNRLALYEDLSGIFAKSQDTRGVLLFIDLDNFKFINDSIGHSFGDQLIKRIGERLAQILKDVGTIYRLGGDEFVVYIYKHKGVEEVIEYALRILNSFKTPFEIGNRVLQTTFSIGISLFPEHGSNPDQLLKHADIAMYRAKEEGKNRFVIFDKTMNEAVSERMVIEKHLRTALEKNEFQIHYQPQLDLKTGKISGFEALLRWQSPELGTVSPIKFIKVAEDTHIIIEIGKWVLQNACSFIKRLHRIGYSGLSVSVNVSMLQLLQDGFMDEVMEVLYHLELEPEYLELEITESILMESYDMIGKKLMKLQHHGVRIALDDFGKGYSSLHYLLKLPITTLKIDKTFIDSITLETKERTLTGQIVSIGTSMGLCVVAEGVETQEQMDYLVENECHKIQGYHFSRPVQEKEVEALLMREKL